MRAVTDFVNCVTVVGMVRCLQEITRDDYWLLPAIKTRLRGNVALLNDLCALDCSERLKKGVVEGIFSCYYCPPEGELLALNYDDFVYHAILAFMLERFCTRRIDKRYTCIVKQLIDLHGYKPELLGRDAQTTLERFLKSYTQGK